ncbi:nickel-responsive transcriptional regulator NikR [Collinsella sp. AGMB00827]|uniref:Putative nickel-responsive regulator n=1 Tax=Collinsella ureilytica TaxID=2869515 RepID=A0ABS7MJU2_9ACTN|nr:nickel-responsive transcriptional regulator NikR [Collinsella urealyticum]MBY4797636.1 nickel-responsive transcriptional regulator NikR [Collinsella urealyticum]
MDDHHQASTTPSTDDAPGDSSQLVRFSVTVPEDLLRAFDDRILRKGDVVNRSSTIRDLIRASLVEESQRTPEVEVIGSLTMIYDHHIGDLTRRLDEVQHDYTDEIVSTMHVHLDHHNCLEILALKGRGSRIYELADHLLGLRGVSHGKLACAATENSLGL